MSLSGSGLKHNHIKYISITMHSTRTHFFRKLIDYYDAKEEDANTHHVFRRKISTVTYLFGKSNSPYSLILLAVCQSMTTIPKIQCNARFARCTMLEYCIRELRYLPIVLIVPNELECVYTVCGRCSFG